VKLTDEPITQGFIQIIDVRAGKRVVTILEFLSPTNKVPGHGQSLYLTKQREAREAGVNLVEIDLTRSGDRSSVLPVYHIPPSHRTTYLACVRRALRSDEVEVYPLSLQSPLPIIAVPLRETDADVPLDLQSLVDQCYLNGRYDDLDYTANPDPPLSPKEEIWIQELLRSAGKRTV
jgi:hypothetical protein